MVCQLPAAGCQPIAQPRTRAACVQSIRQAGTFKTERVLVSPQQALVRVAGREEPVLNFCANNYLGLSSDPAVCRAAADALASHGLVRASWARPLRPSLLLGLRPAGRSTLAAGGCVTRSRGRPRRRA